MAMPKNVYSEHCSNALLENCQDNTSFNGCLKAEGAQHVGDRSDAWGLLCNSDMAVRTLLLWEARPIHGVSWEQIESG